MKTLSTLVAVVFASVVVAGCTMQTPTDTDVVVDENVEAVDVDAMVEEVVEEVAPTIEEMPAEAVEPTTDDEMDADPETDIPPVDMGDAQAY
jgi:hypothetical protein